MLPSPPTPSSSSSSSVSLSHVWRRWVLFVPLLSCPNNSSSSSSSSVLHKWASPDRKTVSLSPQRDTFWGMRIVSTFLERRHQECENYSKQLNRLKDLLRIPYLQRPVFEKKPQLCLVIPGKDPPLVLDGRGRHSNLLLFPPTDLETQWHKFRRWKERKNNDNNASFDIHFLLLLERKKEETLVRLQMRKTFPWFGLLKHLRG